MCIRDSHDIVAKSGVVIEYLDESYDGWASLNRIFADADWIVDALLGIGATGHPRAPMDDLISCMNSAVDTKKVAVDIPSGLDCDTGEIFHPTVKATHTCTFVAAKPGHLEPPAQDYVGELHVLDIGVPSKLLREFNI